MEFSLFYFGSDEGNTDPYRLLLAGAEFADGVGFTAVWTPERHFHRFGGLYPNPSVTGAAVAARTRRVAVRAGSVVAPLHHPIRIAEEWSVVDQISRGRVGISLASGWQAEDFALRPEAYPGRRDAVAETVTTIRQLWRGETIEAVDGAGNPTLVRIHPAPARPSLPLWLTSGGTTRTFELAGELGTGILTHLLGQDADELQIKIRAYRAAWRQHDKGMPAPHVTLMLHTFVGLDREEVRERVREPFVAYLTSSFGLLGRSTQATGGLDPAQLAPDEIDYVVRRSFDRYFTTSGMFGTVADATATVRQLAEAGVDEVACLIDFGVDPDTVLSHLKHLCAVRDTVAAVAQSRGGR